MGKVELQVAKFAKEKKKRTTSHLVTWMVQPQPIVEPAVAVQEE